MSSHLPLKSPPKKICILRISALGDVTHVLPVVRAIQQQWPNVEITWICGKFEYKLLRLIEGVNFIIFDKKSGFKAYYYLWEELKSQRFDVLLHMQVALRANIASLLVRANIRLGWDSKRSRDLHQLFINHSVAPAIMQHQLDGFRSFATSLGIPVSQPEWAIPVTTSAEEFIQQHIKSDRPLLVISACSSHVLRNWSATAYAEVADYAINKYAMQVVLSGGPAEIEVKMSDEISRHMKNPVINLVGKDTLEQLVGLLSKAAIVISPDTGPAHIASALGVPVIGLYACTWSKRSGPYNSLLLCVDKFAEAAQKYLNKSADSIFWGTKIERVGVMDLITVNDVCEKIDIVMKGSN